MSTKRPRTEDEIKLNDSIQTLVSEFRAKPDLSTNDIGQFMISYLEKTEEMRTALFESQFRINQLENRVDKIEKSETAIIENSKAIEKLDEEVEKQGEQLNDLEEATLRNEESINKLDQAKIDNDVFISGFPMKPDLNKVTTALLNLYGISEDLVVDKYQYEFTARLKKQKHTSTPTALSSKVVTTSKVYHHVVISLKDKATKIRFMAAKKSKGPVKYEQVCNEEMAPEHKETTIRVSNRLSRFNLRVQGELLNSRSAGKIHKVQLHNCLFRIQRTENSKWEMVGTETALKPFIMERPKKNN